MSNETTSPSAAVLRNLATSVALDLAHAPLKSRHYERLMNLTRQYLALEKTMTSTSEMVKRAMGHAEELMEEARIWQSISEERGTLASGLDQSMTRVSGVNATATVVSAEDAHP